MEMTTSTHSVCVNGTSIGATLGASWNGQGVFVIAVAPGVSAVRVGDRLMSLRPIPAAPTHVPTPPPDISIPVHGPVAALASYLFLPAAETETEKETETEAKAEAGSRLPAAPVVGDSDTGSASVSASPCVGRSLQSLGLNDVHSLLRGAPRPFTLIVQRGHHSFEAGPDDHEGQAHAGEGASRALRFLQCPVRGPAFLASISCSWEKDAVDAYLTLAHIHTLGAGADGAAVLQSRDMQDALASRGFMANASTGCTASSAAAVSITTGTGATTSSTTTSTTVCTTSSGLTPPDTPCMDADGHAAAASLALTFLLEHLQSRMITLVHRYVTSPAGAARMSYYHGHPYSSLTLADVLVQPKLIKGLYFFAKSRGLQHLFGGMRIGSHMFPINAASKKLGLIVQSLKAETLLQLACIMPNSADLSKFSDWNNQLIYMENVSVHKPAFADTPELKTLEVETPMHDSSLVFFTEVEIISVWTKKARTDKVDSGDVMDLPHKMIEFCRDLLGLKDEVGGHSNLLSFQHGQWRGAVNSNSLVFTSDPCCSLNALREIIDAESPPSELATIIKFQATPLLHEKKSINSCPTTANIIAEIFNAESLTKILIAILIEARILFVSANALSAHAYAIEYIIKLIAPLKWVHIIEPIIPSAELSKILQMPFPFICGIPHNFLSEELFNDEIIIFDVDTGCVKIPERLNNIFVCGLVLKNNLEKLFKPALHNIDSFTGMRPDNLLNLPEIAGVCNNFIQLILFRTTVCATLIHDEILFDEERFVELNSINFASDAEKEFLLLFSRTQHFSCYLTEVFF